MIKILIAVALLCGAIFLGPRLADSQGFVHIATEGYIVETSLTTAIILAIVAFLVLHIIVNLINRSVKLPKRTSLWFSGRRVKKQQHLQNEAALAYEEAAYARGLSLLNKVGGKDKLSAPSLLIGAKCAFHVNDLDECRNYLDHAENCKDTSRIACKLLRAKLNLKLGNAAAALENLDTIQGSDGTDAGVTKLKYECYQSEQQLDKIKDLLPALKKLKLVDEEDADQIAQSYAFDAVRNAKEAAEVDNFIATLSKAERRNAVIMAPVLTKLVELDQVEEASKLAIKLLQNDNEHQEALFNAIATWDKAAPKVLEELNRQASANAIGSQTNMPLLKAMANLELKENKLSEAKDHISQALNMERNNDLYILAADLNKRLKRDDEAVRFYDLAVKAKKAPDLPEID